MVLYHVKAFNLDVKSEGSGVKLSSLIEVNLSLGMNLNPKWMYQDFYKMYQSMVTLEEKFIEKQI